MTPRLHFFQIRLTPTHGFIGLGRIVDRGGPTVHISNLAGDPVLEVSRDRFRVLSEEEFKAAMEFDLEMTDGRRN